jgi:hypothetical protein
MASRASLIQSRSIYVGTLNSVAPSDGNLIVTGNVGIGTTSPAAKLQVENAGDVLNLKLTTGGYNTLTLSTVNFSGGNNYAINPYITGVSNGGFEIKDLTNNASRIAIAPTSGNVGIGTTSPANKLSVIGAVNASSILVSATNTTFSEGTGAINGQIYFDPVRGNRSLSVTTQQVAAGDDIDGVAFNVFYTNTGDPVDLLFRNGGNNNLCIKGNGNIGIGTSTPSQKLHIDGNVRVTGAYYDSSNSAGSSGQVLSSTGSGTDWVSLSEITGVDGTGTANYIAKWSDADTIANSQLFDNGTNVGIGTTSPNAKLQVVGTMSASNIISNNSSSNGTTVLAYQDQFKRVYTTSVTFTYTAAGTYYFNLVFTTNQGFTYDLTATTSREGLWRNFGALRDNSYLNVESDGDFETHAVGDVQIISNDMYLDAPPTAFKSATTNASGVNGTSPWAYYIVRYAVYIPTYAGNTDGFFKVHLTTYGYTGSAPLFINA